MKLYNRAQFTIESRGEPYLTINLVTELIVK